MELNWKKMPFYMYECLKYKIEQKKCYCEFHFEMCNLSYVHYLNKLTRC